MVSCLTSPVLKNGLTVNTDGNLVFHFPSSNFHASVDINSQRGIEPHSLEANIGLESINLTIDLVQELINRLKRRDTAKSPPPPPQPSPFIPTSPSLFSPLSPSLQFMVNESIPVNPFRSHPLPAVSPWIHREERPQEDSPRREFSPFIQCHPSF